MGFGGARQATSTGTPSIPTVDESDGSNHEPAMNEGCSLQRKLSFPCFTGHHLSFMILIPLKMLTAMEAIALKILHSCFCRKLVDMEIMSYRSPCIPRHCRLFCCYSIPAFFFSYRNTTTVGCHPNQRRLYR